MCPGHGLFFSVFKDLNAPSQSTLTPLVVCVVGYSNRGGGQVLVNLEGTAQVQEDVGGGVGKDCVLRLTPMIAG